MFFISKEDKKLWSEYISNINSYSLNFNLNKKFITTAFQRRFRQNLVNGIPDQECFLISKNLLKS